VQKQLKEIRPDVLGDSNPNPNKVSGSGALFSVIHERGKKETPIVELR